LPLAERPWYGTRELSLELFPSLDREKIHQIFFEQNLTKRAVGRPHTACKMHNPRARFPHSARSRGNALYLEHKTYVLKKTTGGLHASKRPRAFTECAGTRGACGTQHGHTYRLSDVALQRSSSCGPSQTSRGLHSQRAAARPRRRLYSPPQRTVVAVARRRCGVAPTVRSGSQSKPRSFTAPQPSPACTIAPALKLPQPHAAPAAAAATVGGFLNPVRLHLRLRLQ